MSKKTFMYAIVIGIPLLAVISVAVAILLVMHNINQLPDMKIPDVDLSRIADGTYNGSDNVFPIYVSVGVTVKNHTITNIAIIKHTNGKGAAAEAIVNKVIKKQSLQVDTVSGATYSSKVILKAIENALENASGS